MKKALIIASCGLLLALIIGATTQGKDRVDNIQHKSSWENKCSEPINDEPAPKCALRCDDKQIADIFLRGYKRKLRLAYA